MRYYTYISDSKLDMLYDQIPAKIRSRIVTELKLDIKVVSLSIREQPSAATRYGKLGVVEKYIAQQLDVGSITAPAAWFRGRLSLRSGIYRNAPGGLAYFAGIDDGVELALIGSARHLVGSREAVSDITLSYSGMPALFRELRRDEESAPSNEDEERVVAEVRDFAGELRGFPEPSEFLARRLLHRAVADMDSQVTHVLLGTPLYVALSDAA
jgi:Family of unknown function (DUF7019)